jgi:hypothetical protein
MCSVLRYAQAKLRRYCVAILRVSSVNALEVLQLVDHINADTATRTRATHSALSIAQKASRRPHAREREDRLLELEGGVFPFYPAHA